MSSGRKIALFFASGLLATMAYISRRKGYKNQTEDIQKSETAGKRLKFTNKTVLITGAAVGIGAATAHAFAKEGATLVLVDLPEYHRKMSEAKKGLLIEGAQEVHVLGANMCNSQDVQRMVSEAVSACGRIDCFFNNDEVPQREMVPLHEHPDKDFHLIITFNLYGMFLGMKYVSQAMMSNKKGAAGGVIVNTASMAGLIGPGNMAAYVASKFGVVGLTKTGAKDLAPHNIRVVAIAPGLIEEYLQDMQLRLVPRILLECKEEEEPSKREIKVQEARMLGANPWAEIAEIVVFLCSDSASYITGSVIPIEGGRLQ